jgi:hypothetical protein
MNKIAAVALIFSISCAGRSAVAGPMPLPVRGNAAVSSETDLSVIQVRLRNLFLLNFLRGRGIPFPFR